MVYSPLDPNWDYCIRQGCPRVTYVDFYYPASATEPTIENIPVESFNLTADRRNDIRRVCDLTVVSEELLEEIKQSGGGGSLEPYGGELRLRHGMVITETGDEITVPLGVFHIETLRYDDPGAVMNFQLVDRAMVLKRKLYGFPRDAAGQGTLDVMNGPIADLLPYATQIFDADVIPHIIPGGVQHRGDMLTILNETAASMGAELFFDVDGNARLMLTPTLEESFSGAPDWEVDCGSEGVLVSAKHDITRTDTYNRVLVIGVNPTTTTSAVYADIQDTDPSSPTYYDGPFGKHDLWIDDNTLSNYDLCLQRAQVELDDHRGLSRTVELTTLSNPALEPSDVIRVTYIDGSKAFHLIDSFTLNHSGSMEIHTRTEREQ